MYITKLAEWQPPTTLQTKGMPGNLVWLSRSHSSSELPTQYHKHATVLGTTCTYVISAILFSFLHTQGYIVHVHVHQAHKMHADTKGRACSESIIVSTYSNCQKSINAHCLIASLGFNLLQQIINRTLKNKIWWTHCSVHGYSVVCTYNVHCTLE
jgi:hypothetical protein